MTPREAEAAVAGRRAGGIKPGLARMEQGLALLGHPEEALRVVHIAGTNGKGSTARMIQAAATACGVRTGLYTSPAVTGLRDTITVDGVPIPGEAFAALAEELIALESQLDGGDAFSEFELTTLLALTYFAREGAELCVVECGMGGRGDATDVFRAPLAAVLTPVALDHTAWLGRTIGEIAAHKCGIIKAPCAVVTAPDQAPEALGAIYEAAAAQGLTVRQPAAAAAPILEAGWGRTVFEYRGRRYALPLTGVYQRDNALTALETLDCLREKGYLLPEERVAEGLASVSMPCRQEAVRREPLVILDGAHNPHGAAALAGTLRLLLPPGAPLTAVLGMLEDKDAGGYLAEVAPLCARIVCCRPDNPRAREAASLAAEAGRFCPDVRAVAAPREALRLARALAGEDPLLVAGSFYLAAAVRPLFLPPRESSDDPFEERKE